MVDRRRSQSRSRSTESTEFAHRRAEGRAVRALMPRGAHREIRRDESRPDPVRLLHEQAATRVAELVPVRYERMLVSPFTFYRGAAAIMASDLSRSPHTGLTVQLCGDAHLSNFGLFGTPERSLIFDINDFDETHPGPFEWDVKRLAASVEVAGRSRGFTREQRRSATLAAVRGYREHMRLAAESRVLDVWYDRVDEEHVRDWILAERRTGAKKKDLAKRSKNLDRVIAKARSRDSQRAFSKLVHLVNGEPRFIADPPLIVPIDQFSASAEGVAPGADAAATTDAERENEVATMHALLDTYQNTLASERNPLREYTYLHLARKVVGVGSVGTRAWVILLRGRDNADPLILQAKEAQKSVLERYLEPCTFDNQGERVVRGQRLMQAASDIFLGWQRVVSPAGVSRDFYLRQLHDWKGSVDVDTMEPAGAEFYARLCGETLARGHARSGDRVAIAAYLGQSTRFDEAIADFAAAYADLNDDDYARFSDAVASGRVLGNADA